MFDERFDGWVEADFAPYAERKWRSNRFNLERRRVRSRLIDLVTRAAAELPTEGLAVWSGLDHPSFFNGHAVRAQRVAWSRSEAARQALMRANPAVESGRVATCHAHLGLEVDASGVRLILEVPVDAAFDRSVDAADSAEPLASALGATWTTAAPGSWRLERAWHPLHSAEPLAAANAGASPESRETDATAPPLAAAQIAEVAHWLATLWPAFLAALWREDNDPAGLAAAVSAAAAKPSVDAAAGSPASDLKTKTPRAQPPASRSPTPPWRARGRSTIAPPGSGRDAKAEEAARLAAARAAAERESAERAARALALLSAGSQPRDARGAAPRREGARSDARRQPERRLERDERSAARSGKRGRASGASRPSAAAPAKPERAAGKRAAAGPRTPRPYEARPAIERATVAVGAAVELTAGLFSGKRGVVRGVKGNQAEVEVGGMQLRVRLTELRALA